MCSLLEDDDPSGLFITQEPRKVDGNSDNFDINRGNGGDYVDLSQGAVGEMPTYSDISDDDFVDIPSSQRQNRQGMNK